MNYKNSIFFVTLSFLITYVIIFYQFQVNQSLLYAQKLILESTYLKNLFIAILFLIASVLITLFFYRKFERKIVQNSQKQQESIKLLGSINDFYNTLQNSKNIINIAKESVHFVANQFDAKGIFYLVNQKNKNLELLDSYNIDISNKTKIKDLYSGVIGEAFATKKVKKYIQKDKTTIALPLISNNQVVGIIKLIFDDDLEFNLSKSDNIILKIIADSIYKELEHTQNKKYMELIDNYISLSSTNTQGDITYASKAFSKNSGYPKKELLNKNHRILKHEEVEAKVYEEMWETITSGKTWKGEIINRKKDGTTYWADLTISPDFDHFNNIVGYDSMRIDTTDKKMVERLSITDSLTNLYNRRYFDEIFPQKISLAKRYGINLFFCLIDIDHFKQYNDNYGHQMGDKALQKVAKSLSTTLKRKNDHVFRLGGEEFGVLYTVEKNDDGFDIAELIRKNIELLEIEHEHNTASKYITISMGVYVYEDENITADKIYKRTDDLLYKAKENGRNQIQAN